MELSKKGRNYSCFQKRNYENKFKPKEDMKRRT